jgi:hypothetical protein
MQCAPVAASLFALRQAFAELASGKILRSFAKARIGSAKHMMSRGIGRASGESFACSTALGWECSAVD